MLITEGHANPQYLQSTHVKLHRYRRNGIRHVEECHEFEVARARRDKKKENKKKAVSIRMVGLRLVCSARATELMEHSSLRDHKETYFCLW